MMMAPLPLEVEATGMERLVMVFWSLCLPVLLCIPCRAGDKGLDALEAGCATAVKNMVECIPPPTGPGESVTVAALPLLDSDGRAIRRLGVQVAQMMNRLLANHPNKKWLRVADRITLTSVLEEQKLWISTVVAGKDAEGGRRGSPGKLIERARFLVVGTTNDAGPEVVIEMKLVRIDGVIIAAESVRVPKSAGIRALLWYVQRPAPNKDDPLISVEVPPIQISWTVVGLRRRPGNIIEEVNVRNGTILRSKDMFHVRFTPLSDCYVYLILFGSAGKAQVLFPHPEIKKDNYCRGGVTHRVPQGDRWYWLDDHPGTEMLYLVASYAPMDDLAALLAKMEKAGAGRALAASERVRREIQRVRDRGATDASRGVKVLSVRGVGGIGSPTTFDITLPDRRRIKRVGEIIRGDFSLVKEIRIEHK